MSIFVIVRLNGSESDGHWDVPGQCPTVQDILKIIQRDFEGHVDRATCPPMTVKRAGNLLHPDSHLHTGDILFVEY